MKNSIRNYGIGAMITLALNAGCSWQDVARVAVYGGSKLIESAEAKRKEEADFARNEIMRRENAEINRKLEQRLMELENKIKNLTAQVESAQINGKDFVPEIDYFEATRNGQDYNGDGTVSRGEFASACLFRTNERIEFYGKLMARVGTKIRFSIEGENGNKNYSDEETQSENGWSNLRKNFDLRKGKITPGKYIATLQVEESEEKFPFEVIK